MFANTYAELPVDFYGKWMEPVKTFSSAKEKCPDHADYKLPTTQEEWDAMLKKMEECGIDREAGIKAICKRKDEYVKALNEYRRRNESKRNDGN